MKKYRRRLVPLQTRPSIDNDIPGGHEHLKLPTVLTQPCEHGFSCSHSSISAYISICMIICIFTTNATAARRTRSLRSSTSHQLDIPTYRLESIGRRSFPVAASTLWNTLPSEIQSSPSLTLFRQRLKTYLFQKSFPDVLLWWLRLHGPRNNIGYSGPVKYISDWLIDYPIAFL